MSILLLHRAQAEAVVEGLQALYLMDEGSGQTVADHSGAGRDGTLGSSAGGDANDPTWTAAGLSYATNDYVDCGSDAALRSSQWTVCVALKLTPASTVNLAGWSTSNQYPGVYAAAPFNGNRPLIWLNADCWRYFDKSSPVDLQDAGWHFLVFVCPGNTAADIVATKLRVDGQDQPAFSTSSTEDGTTKNVLRIGTAGGVQYSNMEAAFFALHDRVLTTSEQDQMRAFAKQTLAGRVALP